ncbi:MAG TPA: D-alanyl-D-alanine carboxypeptidase/D-alanyl-D-alanine-endopeptidase [Bacteroidales bacterium]|nr:D-alanyl-D-alanine carboxypeptidase/D-alanyl-D-alanine-endopeptidase [Bacteroidales bacterium]
MKKLFLLIFLFTAKAAFSQGLDNFLSDTTLIHSSFSLYVADVETGQTVLDIYSEKSLVPASILKLITTAAAIELLGPDHVFNTAVGYTGTLNKAGMLKGDIIIKGGGDPVFASPRFPFYYGDFPYRWIDEIKRTGIRKVSGRVIVDDSYYDYNPVPSGWLWEDAGNYYGAGVYGASIYDNSYDIHFITSSAGTKPVITEIVPEDCSTSLENNLVADGNTDNGYIFSSPYGNNGWMTGTIPVNQEDFVLGASIQDPPMIFAKSIDVALRNDGVKIKGSPTTARIEKIRPINEYKTVAKYTSPFLSEIIDTLNHISVNLYAETLVKELDKHYKGKGTLQNGLKIINLYLDSLGIKGMYLADGSGLSRANAINAKGLTELLIHMKNNGRYFDYYLNSLPDAGKEGTLKNWFRDDVFAGNLKAKSGSMTRVRSYAGYFTSKSGRQMAFTFIANDFPSPSANIVAHYENILREIILYY